MNVGWPNAIELQQESNVAMGDIIMRMDNVSADIVDDRGNVTTEAMSIMRSAATPRALPESRPIETFWARVWRVLNTDVRTLWKMWRSK